MQSGSTIEFREKKLSYDYFVLSHCKLNDHIDLFPKPKIRMKLGLSIALARIIVVMLRGSDVRYLNIGFGT